MRSLLHITNSKHHKHVLLYSVRRAALHSIQRSLRHFNSTQPIFQRYRSRLMTSRLGVIRCNLNQERLPNLMISRTGIALPIKRSSNLRAISTPKRARNRPIIRNFKPPTGRQSRSNNRFVTTSQISTIRHIVNNGGIIRTRCHSRQALTLYTFRYASPRILSIICQMFINIKRSRMTNSITRCIVHNVILTHHIMLVNQININHQVITRLLVSNSRAIPRHTSTFQGQRIVTPIHHIRTLITNNFNSNISRQTRQNHRATNTQADRPIFRRPASKASPSTIRNK